MLACTGSTWGTVFPCSCCASVLCAMPGCPQVTPAVTALHIRHTRATINAHWPLCLAQCTTVQSSAQEESRITSIPSPKPTYWCSSWRSSSGGNGGKRELKSRWALCAICVIGMRRLRSPQHFQVWAVRGGNCSLKTVVGLFLNGGREGSQKKKIQANVGKNHGRSLRNRQHMAHTCRKIRN